MNAESSRGKETRTSKPPGLLEATSRGVGVCVGTAASVGKRVTQTVVGSALVLGGMLRRPAVAESNPASVLPEHDLNSTAAQAPEAPPASEPTEFQREKESLLVELRKARSETREAAGHAKSQLRDLQEERERVACDLEIARSALQEGMAREDALKTQVGLLESEFAFARREMRKTRDEADLLRSELADATSRLSAVISTVSSENETVAPDFAEGQSSPSGSAGASPSRSGVEEEAQPSRESIAAPRDGQTNPAGSGQESRFSAAAAEAQIPPAVSPEEAGAAVFPNAAQKVIFTRAFLDLAGQNAATRATAAKALGGVRHELSVRILAAHVAHEPSPQVRQECVKSLTAMNRRGALPAVQRALTDPAASVRLAAVRGVYRLAGRESAPALASVLYDPDEEVRRRAATCIGWLGGEEHVAELLPLLMDPSVSVRRTAIEALGNLRSIRAVSRLIDCLSDPEDSIRRAASAALDAVTGKKMCESFPEDADSLERLIARWCAWWSEYV